jgi:zinc/manganese transport system substrate-binding protein
MRRLTPTLSLIAGLAASTLAFTGCAASTSAPAEGDGVSVVASTDVYGSIAEAIGGELVTVTSLITGAAQDPHSFEASARDQLTVSRADLVIENGGGYDPFIDTLLAASPSDAAVLDASETSGLVEVAGEHFNEHVWYSLGGVKRVAEAIARELSTVDPDNSAAYETNLAAFAAEMAQLEAFAEGMRAGTRGLGVAVTEPVPLYLLEAAGFTNRTPADFSEAIEEGADVSPAALADTLDLFPDGAVSLLAYNGQTASSETERVRTAADEAGVPVVEFTETLPEGTDYVAWMTDNLYAISAALE